MIDTLKALLPPPVTSFETPISREEWDFVETSLGTELPSDYKEFISAYGTGCIDGFLWVMNPFSKNKNLNLVNRLKPLLDALAEIHREQTPLDYALYPDKGGILPWAASDNGDVFYWVCNDSPSRWRIVGHDSRVIRWQTFDLSATKLLVDVFFRKMTVDFFPDDVPSPSPKFVAVPPRSI